MTIAHEGFLFSYTFEGTVKGTNKAAVAVEKFGEIEGVYAYLLDPKEYSDPTIHVCGKSSHPVEEVMEVYGQLCRDYGVVGALHINWGLAPVAGCATAVFDGEKLITCVCDSLAYSDACHPTSMPLIPHTGFMYYNTEKRVKT